MANNCLDCGKQISSGAQRCCSCNMKGSRHYKWKKGKPDSFCVDCGKQISIDAERCNSCNNKGSRSSNWKGGNRAICVDCGIKLANRHAKRCFPCAMLKNGSGEKHRNWKGDNAKYLYRAIHRWLDKNYGKPKLCEHCGTTTASRYQWANINGHVYRRLREDYKRLCTKCHKQMDVASK